MLEICSVDRFAFMQIFQFICKYCITNVNEVVFTQSSPDVPFKLFYPKQDLRAKLVSPKKIMHTETFHEVAKNASTCFDSNLEVMNQNGMFYNSKNNCEYFSSADFNKGKCNLSFKDTLTYKKRVSLAVKRYNLRKRRSTAILKCSKSNSPEEFKLFDKEQEHETGPMNDCFKARDVILQRNEQNFTNKKKRRPRKKTNSKDQRRTNKEKSVDNNPKQHGISLEPNDLIPTHEKRNDTNTYKYGMPIFINNYV
ncbi:hypothetical protein TNCV_2765731 [Trichonephila clavipes]|nr:hypothetical protein TNCV_2765731 [Trichonephila clavipes]